MSSQAINRIGAGQAAQVNANVTTSQIFPLASNLLAPAAVYAEAGGGVLEQKKFFVRGSGFVTSSTTLNVTLTLFVGLIVPATNPLTPGSWTIVGASTARAVNSVSCPWFYEAELVADFKSGKLQGTFKDMINNLFDAPAAITNVLTGVALNSLTVEPGLAFAIGVAFSAGAVANIGNLGEFEVAV